MISELIDCDVHPIDAAIDELADHAGQHLGIADLQVPAAAVVVVLPGPGEVGQQRPRRGALAGVGAGEMVCSGVIVSRVGSGLSGAEQAAVAILCWRRAGCLFSGGCAGCCCSFSWWCPHLICPDGLRQY